MDKYKDHKILPSELVESSPGFTLGPLFYTNVVEKSIITHCHMQNACTYTFNSKTSILVLLLLEPVDCSFIWFQVPGVTLPQHGSGIRSALISGRSSFIFSKAALISVCSAFATVAEVHFGIIQLYTAPLNSAFHWVVEVLPVMNSQYYEIMKYWYTHKQTLGFNGVL